jgi:hypothetical protein
LFLLDQSNERELCGRGWNSKRDGDYERRLQLDRSEQQLVHHNHVRRQWFW